MCDYWEASYNEMEAFMPKHLLSSEPLLTIPEAAAQLGVPVSTLRRAVNAGHITTHSVFNARKRVRLSEVFAAISAKEG